MNGTEFTGERVVPGLVDADLFNEHLARYRFANRLAAGLAGELRVVDLGCGTGYGTAELTAAASISAIDVSADAIGYAQAHYAGARVGFLRAACEALPFAPQTFDIALAFEVIEHIALWQRLPAEARRVLKPSGILLVSTPNRDYYAEARGDAGPNPFHLHEFDYEEFRQSLSAVFPHVRIWAQNHAGAVVFSPENPAAKTLDAVAAGDTSDAHFYMAACSMSPVAFNDLFAWLPSAGNVLRERERHIARLSGELEKKDAWLRETIAAHAELQRIHEALTSELQMRNRWAAELDREIALRNARIAGLQQEQESRLGWIADLESQIGRAKSEIARLHAESQGHEKTIAERTEWAQRLEAEIEGFRTELNRVGHSKWVRAGAKLGLCPRVRGQQ